MAALMGDENGIRLWNKMASSVDNEERQYFQRLTDAAQKYGKIYFSDYSEQQKTKNNQALYSMIWNGNDWVISLFLIPEGANILTYNNDDMWEEIDPNDIIIEEAI